MIGLEPDGSRVDHARLLAGRHLGLCSRSEQERSPMPLATIAGVPNHIALIAVVVIVVLAGGAWWLIDRRK